jgi:hypothetical protein
MIVLILLNFQLIISINIISCICCWYNGCNKQANELVFTLSLACLLFMKVIGISDRAMKPNEQFQFQIFRIFSLLGSGYLTIRFF